MNFFVLRKVDHYECYDDFEWDIAWEKEGDCYARYRVRIEEMRQSLKILRQACEMIPGGATENLEAKKENFKKSDVVNQAIMRYNQLFASQITITIPGDFSLHAGDCVWMDIPEVSESENKACGDEVNKMDGG